MFYLKLLKVSYDHATFKKRNFSEADSNYKSNFEQIGIDFLSAYNFSLGRSELLACEKYIETNSIPYNIGFMYEGASMAQGFNIEFGVREKKAAYTQLFEKWDDHVYMVYVGLGWSYCRIPFFNVEKRMQSFHPLFRWLIIDGMGFHDTYFKTKKVLVNKRVNQQLISPHAIHVYYQGVGRCLWFVTSGNLSYLKKTILTFPKEYQGDLWAGVGLASVYAVGVDESILMSLRSLPEDLFPSFAQGVCFGSKARVRAKNVTEKNTQSVQILLSMSLYEAASLTDQFFPELFGDSTALDNLWKRNIQNYFK